MGLRLWVLRQGLHSDIKWHCSLTSSCYVRDRLHHIRTLKERDEGGSCWATFVDSLERVLRSDMGRHELLGEPCEKNIRRVTMSGLNREDIMGG